MANVVYIFGAGASRDFGFPLGLEIFSYAEAYSELDSEVGRKLKEVIAEIRGIMEILFPGLAGDREKYPAFEEVLTFLWDRFWTDHEKDRDFYNKVFEKYGHSQKVFESFVRFLGLTLLAATDSATCQGKRLLLNRFIEEIDYSNNRISFIDFNYDTLVDDALAICRVKGVIEDYTYTIPLYDVNDKFESFSPFERELIRSDGIQLLKPHGSVNLCFCPHRQANYGDGYFLVPRNLEKYWLNREKCPCCGSQLNSLIIPPLYNKREYIKENAYKSGNRINFRATPEHFRTYVENGLQEVLANADEFVIVGYSLPPYDFDFKNILIDGLVRNEKKNELKAKIITKGKEEAERLAEIFGNLIPHVDIVADCGFLSHLNSL